jgi:hypothetical protein
MELEFPALFEDNRNFNELVGISRPDHLGSG